MEQTLGQTDRAAFKHLMDDLAARSKGNAASESLLAMVVVSGIALYAAEKDSGGPIKTLSDALWNSLSTVCAVGESGCPPVTSAGRLICSALMLLGNPIYEKSKSDVTQFVNLLTGDTDASRPADLEKELLAKLDLVLERLPPGPGAESA